jgi:hypothetical protein
MKRMILTVVFKHASQPLQIMLPDGEAQSLVRAFTSGAKAGYAHGYVKEEDFTYSFDWSEVAALYLNNLELLQKAHAEAQKQQMAGKPSLPPGKGFGPDYFGQSGRN